MGKEKLLKVITLTLDDIDTVHTVFRGEWAQEFFDLAEGALVDQVVYAIKEGVPVREIRAVLTPQTDHGVPPQK